MDSDNDGVNDCDDDCNNPGCDTVDASGCPVDSDNDGVNDCDDDCPNEEGDSSNNGCPRPQSSVPTLTPPQETTLSPTSTEGPMGYVMLFLIVALIILFLIYQIISKKEEEVRNLEREKKKLDEMLQNGLISEKEYNIAVRGIEGQLRKLKQSKKADIHE